MNSPSNRAMAKAGAETAILHTLRHEAALGWWVITTSFDVDGGLGANEAPRVRVSPRVGQYGAPPFIIDCGESISVMADDIDVSVYSRDVDVVATVSAIPVAAPGALESKLTFVRERLLVGTWDRYIIPVAAKGVRGWLGTPTPGSAISVQVAQQSGNYCAIKADGVMVDVPPGAMFVDVVNVGAVVVDYELVWLIRP